MSSLLHAAGASASANPIELIACLVLLLAIRVVAAVERVAVAALAARSSRRVLVTTSAHAVDLQGAKDVVQAMSMAIDDDRGSSHGEHAASQDDGP